MTRNRAAMSLNNTCGSFEFVSVFRLTGSKMEDNTDKSARDKQFNTDLNGKTIPKEDRTTQNDRTEFHESFESQQYPYYWNGTDCQYKNAREYAQVLQTWLWQYRFFSAMNTFHCHLVSSMPLQHQPQGVGLQPSVTSEQNVGNLQNVPLEPIRERLIQPHGRAANTTGQVKSSKIYSVHRNTGTHQNTGTH